MQSKKTHRLQATTLVEVILYMFLLGSMIMVIGGFVREIYVSRNKQQSVIEVENEIAAVMGSIERDLKTANAVSAPAVAVTGATLTMTANAVPITYAVASGAVTRNTVPITSNRVTLSSFSVTHISTVAAYHVITVSFTAAHVNPDNRSEFNYSRTYRTSVFIRPNP